MNGHFIISLDFEKHWGVFDKKSVESYKTNLDNVDKVIDRLLELSDKYDVKLTFAIVGFLFAENKDELQTFCPQLKPTYINKNLSPYRLIKKIGENETLDPYHYAANSIKKIINKKKHEIGTHTFSHYYCHETGQTPEQFEADLTAAIAIAKKYNIKPESIVFPRNMIEADKLIDQPYLNICKNNGIKSFRGKEKAFIYNIHTTKFYHGWYIFKLLRFLDCYINITGHNIYELKTIHNNLYNFPSSRLLRAYSNKLKMLEPLKIKRITKSMTKAAQTGTLYHLWWHPHNFGEHINENFNNLEIIFKTYKKLNQAYGFKSETMTSLTNKLK